MKHLFRFGILLAVAAGVSACDSGGCETSDDCPVINCDDGSTVQACLFGACATECSSGLTSEGVTEADAGR